MQDNDVRMLATMGSALNVAKESADALEAQWAAQEKFNQKLDASNTLLGKGKEILQNISRLPIFGGFLDILSGGSVLGFIGKLVGWVADLDKIITATANSLAISKEASQGLYKSFQDNVFAANKVVDALDSAYLSVSNQGKALNALNESFCHVCDV